MSAKQKDTGVKKSRMPRRLGQGALVSVIAAFAISGGIRLSEGVGHVYAIATNQVEEGATPVPPENTAEQAPRELMEALIAREARVKEQELEQDKREQSLKLAREEIDKKLAELVRAEEELAATISIADKAADEDVAKLVTLYENMKPKEAAPLFQAMAPEFAAGFLTRMRPDAAAAVLSNIEPETAYAISVLIAGRNANAPKN